MPKQKKKAKKETKVVQMNAGGVAKRLTAQMTAGAKKKLLEHLGIGGPQSDINSVVEDRTPQVETFEEKVKNYTKWQRKNCVFAIKNKVNGKFLKRTVDKDKKKIYYDDVDVEECTLIGFDHIPLMVSEVLLGKPNLDLETVIVYKDTKGKIKHVE